MKEHFLLQSRWPVRILLALLLALLFWLNFISGRMETVIAFLPALSERMERFIGAQLLYTAITIQLLVLVCFLWQWLCEKCPVLQRLLAAFLVIELGIKMYHNQTKSGIGIAVTCLYVVLALVEWIESRWKKKQQGKREAYLFCLMPFFALYFILLCLSPSPKQPYNWQWFLNICERVQESFQRLAFPIAWNDDVLGDAYIGFSEDGSFFGNLHSKTEIVMTVDGSLARGSYLYLTGRSFDKLSSPGLEWQQSEGESSTANSMDILETLYAVRHYGTEQEMDYINPYYVNVTYARFHTQYLFAPAKTRSLLIEDPEITYVQEENIFLLDGTFRNRIGYQTYSFQLNRSHTIFRELLERIRVNEEEGAEWEEIRTRLLLEKEDRLTYDQLAIYREEVRQRYGQPPRLSERVSQWLAQVINDAETDYEKLQNIENALRQFTYDTRPGILPEKVTDATSFLDYFLLESRTGYCAYFATAFVLLARAEGIPARYVQGFCVPWAGNGNRFTEVTSDMAHAWPEAYIEGLGWLTFEPTPTKEGASQVAWATISEQKEHAASGETRPEDGENIQTDVPMKLPETEETNPKTTDRRFFWLMLYLLAGALAGFGVLLALDALRERMERKKAAPAKLLRVEVARCFPILSAMGLRREEGETLTEFNIRLQDLLFKHQQEPMHFLEHYEAWLYGFATGDEQVLVSVQAEQRRLWKLYAEQAGRAYPYKRAWLYLTRPRF